MSSILDALKKLEEEKDKGGLPSASRTTPKGDATIRDRIVAPPARERDRLTARRVSVAIIIGAVIIGLFHLIASLGSSFLTARTGAVSGTSQETRNPQVQPVSPPAVPVQPQAGPEAAPLAPRDALPAYAQTQSPPPPSATESTEDEPVAETATPISKPVEMDPIPVRGTTKEGVVPVLPEGVTSAFVAEPRPESKDSSASDGASALYYDVASEWGRTPEQAAAEGPNVSSLKGMTCAVRPGVSDADLAALGRLFRNQFDAYDNINIEVFDSLEAAQQSGSNRPGAAAHRVLGVSKHRASGRDVIMLIKGDVATPVLREE